MSSRNVVRVAVLIVALTLVLASCTDDPDAPAPSRVTSSELRDRVEALLANDPTAINCGYAISDGVLEADVQPPSTNAADVRQDLADRLDVPLDQVRVTLTGRCGDT